MPIYLPSLNFQNINTFPDPNNALDEPDGLLAMGGDLSAQRLISAYQQGIFPWFSPNDPILWWSPSERAVIYPSLFKPSRSLKKFMKKEAYLVSINQSFNCVIEQCSAIRGVDQMWITPDMINAYQHLHQLGYAHSIEVWQYDQLIGGLYGVSVGGIFCGESMFSLKTNASKIALWYFCQHFSQHSGQLIDCQMMTNHLASLGAKPMARADFLHSLQQSSPVEQSTYKKQWLCLKENNSL